MAYLLKICWSIESKLVTRKIGVIQVYLYEPHFYEWPIWRKPNMSKTAGLRMGLDEVRRKPNMIGRLRLRAAFFNYVAGHDASLLA